MRLIISMMLVTLLLSTGYSQKYEGDQKEIDVILQAVENFSAYVMASDYDKIAQCYTEDGKIFPNNQEIMEGRSLIRSFWELPEGVQIAHHKIFPKEIKVMGDVAYDYGLYEGRTKQKNGEEVSWKGKYVIVWKKVENKWKIYLDIWNRIKN